MKHNGSEIIIIKMKNQNDEITFYQNQGFTTSLKAAQHLRNSHRLILYPIGVNQRHKFSKGELIPPFIADELTMAMIYKEKLWGIKPGTEKQLQVIIDSPRFLIYEALYKQGLFVTKGGAFGADFIIYEEDPFLVHGKSLVFIKKPGQGILEAQIAATTVRKTGIIASLDNNGGPIFQTLSR